MKALSSISLPMAVLLFVFGLGGTALGAENFNLDKAHSYPLFKVQHLGLASSFGRLSPAHLDGTFSLKGVAAPLTLKAEVEPVIGGDGHVQLLVRTVF